MALPHRKHYPKRLWILNSQYQVKFVQFKNPNLFGECDSGKKEIRVSNKLSPTATLQTYLHEIFHALFQCEGKSIVSHAQIYQMEKRVATFLMDNFFVDEAEDLPSD